MTPIEKLFVKLIIALSIIAIALSITFFITTKFRQNPELLTEIKK